MRFRGGPHYHVLMSPAQRRRREVEAIQFEVVVDIICSFGRLRNVSARIKRSGHCVSGSEGQTGRIHGICDFFRYGFV